MSFSHELHPTVFHGKTFFFSTRFVEILEVHVVKNVGVDVVAGVFDNKGVARYLVCQHVFGRDSSSDACVVAFDVLSC